jgi:uncharacterized NAD(P)/FAD-binding protein YdhS
VADAIVSGLNTNGEEVDLILNDGSAITVDYCVIATGNHTPRNPPINNEAFYQSKRYFQSPWQIASVKGLKEGDSVLIIGNGLTMVDTVLGLLEQGFKGIIYSVSPNGYNILPHRHNGLKYAGLEGKITPGSSLYELYKLIHAHIKSVRILGLSAEPVIDALRVHTQTIWKSFSDEERQLFMARFRHLWGVARHRVPLHTHDKLQQLRIQGRLQVYAGRVIDLSETDDLVIATYANKNEKNNQQLQVTRVINCTGPDTDLSNLKDSFLQRCLLEGTVTQDKLRLGIEADTQKFGIRRSDGSFHDNLFTLGSNLKGMLWESTAVNELRQQAEHLGAHLSNMVKIEDVISQAI